MGPWKGTEGLPALHLRVAGMTPIWGLTDELFQRCHREACSDPIQLPLSKETVCRLAPPTPSSGNLTALCWA